jgi:hypothetical protein
LRMFQILRSDKTRHVTGDVGQLTHSIQGCPTHLDADGFCLNEVG